MKVKDEIYRGLCFTRYEDIKSLEVMIDDQNFYDEISFINSLCIISEYVSSNRFRYIVFNKLHSELEVNKELHPFINEVIFKQLKSCGINKALFLVTPEMQKGTYSQFANSKGYMISFINYNDVFDWIKDDIQKNAFKTLQDQQ